MSSGRNTLRYYGWSTILLESSSGSDLVFDPFFSSDYGTFWSDIRDYDNVKVICLSHGHHEHYTDAHKIAQRTGATVVAPPRLCDHLSGHFGLPRRQLLPLSPHETVYAGGYEITGFPWYHRKINYLKFFTGRFFTGMRFVLSNLLHTPLDPPFTGFVIKTPEGLKLLNMTEGMNDKMPGAEVEEIARQHAPEVIVGGWQLQFENDVARCVQHSGAKRCVLYHPHAKLFDLMRIPSTPLEVVLERTRKAAPDVELFTPNPREAVALK